MLHREHSGVCQPTFEVFSEDGDDDDGVSLDGEVSNEHTRRFGDVGRFSLGGDTAAAVDACLRGARLGGVAKPAFSHRTDRQDRHSRQGRLQRCSGRKFGQKYFSYQATRRIAHPIPKLITWRTYK